MAQDIHRQAVERFQDASDSVSDQYAKMREDLRFSDPTDPQQWDKTARELRAGRPCLTFDRTNQFIAQVVNQARQNKPAIHCLPADSKADIAVAEKLNGIIRHIEYVSRAGIAYDTAIENAARVGLGWIRVVPEIVRPETNEQELKIKRVLDPLSCYLEAGWTEPDGSDAMHGFVETLMTEAAFKEQYPKASTQPWDGANHGWFGDKQIRVCEYFCIKEEKSNRIIIDGATLTEDEYWELAGQINFKPPVLSTFEAKIRKVHWYKLSGAEVLEETLFPGQLLPLVPMIGHEIWVDGKRHLCGMTRRLMDSQRAYNYERSAFIESVAMQPKAPLMLPVEAMEGLEEQYGALNKGNPAFLNWNHLDSSGNPIPVPIRLQPPAFPVAFAQGGQIATADMESAVGMFRANLGAPGTAVSGRAKREDKVQGDTANFHYTDNQSRSIEQVGRVLLGAMPVVYDQKRQARIMGEDGSQDFIEINPEMSEAVQKKGRKVVAINPSVGSYDARVKTGPAYTTLREEQAEQLAHIMQASPDLTPILADLWVAAQDMPDGEKVRKRLAALLPPQIQQLEDEDGPDIPPEVQAHIGQQQQQIQQMQQMLQEMGHEKMQLELQLKAKDGELQVKGGELEVHRFDAETKRMAVMKPEAPQAAKPDTSAMDGARLHLDAQAQQADIAFRADDGKREWAKLQLDAQNAERERQLAARNADRDHAVQAFDSDTRRKQAMKPPPKPAAKK